ncbi:uncharacterized protein [Musca autumnalis]|uniref:uncharacterized protein n=1 Tax=Musca autumnalis TaxID=221902 RepID=UPI003CF47978
MDVLPILYLGGHEIANFDTLPHDLPLHSGFQGCIYDVHLKAGQVTVPLQETRGVRDHGVGQCGTRECHRHACQHDGAYLQHGATFTKDGMAHCVPNPQILVTRLTINVPMNRHACHWSTDMNVTVRWVKRAKTVKKHLAKKNKIKHRKQNKVGENLAFSSVSSYRVEDAVQAGYGEMEHYDYKNPTISGNTGHFTQVVWKESSQLGVGMVQKNDRTWEVCNYTPPGNVLGKFEDNVPRPKGRQPKPQPSRLITKSKTENDRRPRTPTNLQTAKPQNEQRADDKPSTSQAFKKIIGNKHDKWSKFEMECLEEHNKRRDLHGCKPMALNRNLCNLANDWAIHLTKTRSIYHRPGNDYGENIYQLINQDPTAEDAVKAWYDEINKYKYSKPGFSTGTGHFTQVVWLDTKEMGVGRAKVDNMTFIVCNYNPPGNVMGQYKTQVPPVGGFKYPNRKDCTDAITTSGENETHSTSN